MAKIKLDKNLYARAREMAERAGYASVDEFVIHLIERETKALEERRDDDEVDRQLKGLGYLD